MTIRVRSQEEDPLVPVDHSGEGMRREFGNDPQRLDELRRLLGEDLVGLTSHWFWFTLNEAAGPLTFPETQGTGLQTGTSSKKQ